MMSTVVALHSVVVVAAALYLRSCHNLNLSSPVILFSLVFTDVFLSVIYTSLIDRWLLSSTRNLPYPKGTSIFRTNLFEFLSEPWGFPLSRWQKAMPSESLTGSGFYRVLMGTSDWLIPTTSSAIGTLLNQHSVFVKPDVVRDGLVLSLGVGLVAAEGRTWKKQKKLLTPMFSLHRSRRLVGQAWTKALQLEDRIREILSASPSSFDSTNVEMHPLAMAATLDVIGLVSLGVDLDSIHNPDQEILRAYQAVFPIGDTSKGKTWAQSLLEDMLPVLISPFLLYRLPLRRFRRFHWGLAVLKGFFAEQISSRRGRVHEKNAENGHDVADTDLLSDIMATDSIGDEEAAAHILTIMAAGHESTAVTLAWALYKLAQLPLIQAHLRDEIQTTLGSSTKPGSLPPTLEAINSMKYLRAFLMEVLRLYPAFPGMIRSAAQTATIPDKTTAGSLTIPEGTTIMISPYAINRSTDFWGPDADEFRVERWLDDHSGGATSAHAFMTFSGGPRSCIGKDFAVTSLKVFIVVLVSRFRFTKATGCGSREPVVQQGTSLKPDWLEVGVQLI